MLAQDSLMHHFAARYLQINSAVAVIFNWTHGRRFIVVVVTSPIGDRMVLVLNRHVSVDAIEILGVHRWTFIAFEKGGCFRRRGGRISASIPNDHRTRRRLLM